MKVLIYGDSQTGHTGRELQKLLKAQGHAVTRNTKSGKSSSWLNKNAPSASGYDEVYVFSGGNDGKVQAESVKELLSKLSKTSKVFYFGPPPATLITDLPFAKKVWGSAKTADKFFPQTAAFREKKNTAYKKVTGNLPNVTVLDFRNAPLSNIQQQPSGVMYPSQRDGIHTSGQSAKEAAVYALNRKGKSKDNNILYAGAAVAVVLWLLTRKS
jgi:hypothetical protein